MIKMGQISTTFSKDVMKEMKQHYHDYLKPTPPHALFQAKTTYATITAYKSGKVLFQGKSPQKEAAKWDKHQTLPMSEKQKTNTKEVKSLYHDYLKPSPPPALSQAKTTYATITAYKSGKVLFQGKSPQKEAAKWDKHQTFPMSEKKKTTTKEVPDFIHTSHIGSDESGTGDYFGPVTACAVYIQQDQIALLKEIGIQDSKKLTDQNILTLSEKIISMNIPYS